MKDLFIKSWKTSIVGFLIMGVGGYAAYTANTELAIWALSFGAGALGVFSKDGNVTNAPPPPPLS